MHNSVNVALTKPFYVTGTVKIKWLIGWQLYTACCSPMRAPMLDGQLNTTAAWLKRARSMFSLPLLPNSEALYVRDVALYIFLL